MAKINNYGDLRARLSRYLFHARFEPDYDQATTNFENACNRRLRVRPMETSTPLTTINGVTPLPADYVLWRTVLWTGDLDNELQYVHPAYIDKTVPSRRLFTIEGDTFKARPIDDTVDVYQFHYFQRIPTIIGTPLDSNWLLDAHSDAYLFGVLVELGDLGRNTENATLHKQRRDEVLQEIIQSYALTTGATSSAVRQTGEYF